MTESKCKLQGTIYIFLYLILYLCIVILLLLLSYQWGPVTLQGV